MDTKNKTTIQQMPELWPAELDALAASPKQLTLLFENDRVRVLETCIEPGEITPAHTHRWPSTYYIPSWSDFVRRDADGNVLVDTRGNEKFLNPPVSMWSDPLPPHSLENVGDQPIKLVRVELKTEPVEFNIFRLPSFIWNLKINPAIISISTPFNWLRIGSDG